MDIPVLKLAYPTTREDIINLINKVNLFLKDFDPSIGDDLNSDLEKDDEKLPLKDFKKIFNDTKKLNSSQLQLLENKAEKGLSTQNGCCKPVLNMVK